jgi:hypothetical protein
LPAEGLYLRVDFFALFFAEVFFDADFFVLFLLDDFLAAFLVAITILPLFRRY